MKLGRRGKSHKGREGWLALVLYYRPPSLLNVKAVVAAFNQEKALVEAFSVIVQFHRLIDLRTDVTKVKLLSFNCRLRHLFNFSSRRLGARAELVRNSHLPRGCLQDI